MCFTFMSAVTFYCSSSRRSNSSNISFFNETFKLSIIDGFFSSHVGLLRGLAWNRNLVINTSIVSGSVLKFSAERRPKGEFWKPGIRTCCGEQQQVFLVLFWSEESFQEARNSIGPSFQLHRLQVVSTKQWKRNMNKIVFPFRKRC